MKKSFQLLIAVATGVFLLAGCASTAGPAAGTAGSSASTTGSTAAGGIDYRTLVANPDRSDADRKDDERRKPAELLAFSGVKPGMKVEDVGAGGGYTTELLARAVGPQGVVYAQNSADRPAFEERLRKPALANVVKVVRPFDDPLPPDAAPLDLVTLVLLYHDITYMPVDRALMNERIFAALKSGGHFVVVDHAAKAGAAVGVGKTLHRVDEALVKREVEAAGFKFVASADFLRNPVDPRDAAFFDMKMPSDRFALKFVKP